MIEQDFVLLLRCVEPPVTGVQGPRRLAVRGHIALAQRLLPSSDIAALHAQGPAVARAVDTAQSALLSLDLHGNWCGPGHSGPGAPVDPVDQVCCCRHHRCYSSRGYLDCKSDRDLIAAMPRAIADSRTTAAGRARPRRRRRVLRTPLPLLREVPPLPRMHQVPAARARDPGRQEVPTGNRPMGPAGPDTEGSVPVEHPPGYTDVLGHGLHQRCATSTTMRVSPPGPASVNTRNGSRARVPTPSVVYPSNDPA